LTALSAGNFTISKATPTATLAVNNSPLTYDGTAKAATVEITDSSVAGAVANILTGGSATQTAAGTYAPATVNAIVPTVTGTPSTLLDNYIVTATKGTMTIRKAALSATAN
jgi:hypothetical protein